MSALRMHRSVKIAKGIRLNVSKSGLGLSVGPRGASLSVGPRGTYLNTGIPGTGISSRTKLSGGTSGNRQQLSGQYEERTINFKVEIDDETGKETIRMFENDVEFFDESVMRRVKRDPGFKAKMDEARKQVFQETKDKTDAILTLHHYAESLPDWEKISKEAEQTQPEQYVREVFPETEPTRETVEAALFKEAEQTVKAFFGAKKKRKAYVSEHLEQRFEDLHKSWEIVRTEHESDQDNIEKEKNEEFIKVFEQWKKEMARLLNPDKTVVEERLEDLLSRIELPVEFSVGFEVYDAGKVVLLDIDLPEIEDYPQKKSSLLASGKVSIKDKTQKELKQDYATSICGIAFYFASIALSAAPSVSTVLISGYTQRVNKATGNIDDQYVYSVKIPIEAYEKLNLLKIDTIEALQNFEHVMNMSKTFELKTIEPMSWE